MLAARLVTLARHRAVNQAARVYNRLVAEVTLDRDEWMRRRIGLLYPGLVALCRLTVIPLPRGLQPTTDDTIDSAWWFPAVGAALGLVVCSLAWVAMWVGLVPGLAAVVLVIAAVASSRAMLEFGLARAVTGFGGADGSLARPELTVWGVLALVAVMGLRAGGLIGTNTGLWLAAVVVSQASSRWAMIFFLKVVAGPDDKSGSDLDGPELGDLAPVGKCSWTAFAVASITVAVPAIFLAGLDGVAAVLVGAAVAYGAGALLRRRASGSTESSLTTTACACEVAVLLTFAATHPAVQSPWTWVG